MYIKGIFDSLTYFKIHLLETLNLRNTTLPLAKYSYIFFPILTIISSFLYLHIAIKLHWTLAI